MNKSHLLGAFCAGLFSLGSVSNAATVAVSSDIVVTAFAEVWPSLDVSSAITDQPSSVSAQPGTIDLLSGSVTASVGLGLASVTVNNNISATWVTENSGQVDFFGNWVWDIWDEPNVSGTARYGSSDNLTFWSYAFTTDVDSIFTIDYSTYEIIETPYSVNYEGEDQYSFYVDGIEFNSQGSTTLSVPINTGVTHEVKIWQGGSSISGSGALTTSSWTGSFAWDIAPVSAVPLPAAAYLFGSGLLGLAGIAKRKKA